MGWWNGFSPNITNPTNPPVSVKCFEFFLFVNWVSPWSTWCYDATGGVHKKTCRGCCGKPAAASRFVLWLGEESDWGSGEPGGSWPPSWGKYRGAKIIGKSKVSTPWKTLPPRSNDLLNPLKLDGGNSNMCYFHPETWGIWSNLAVAYFSNGWFNHQVVEDCSWLSSRNLRCY